MDADVFTLSIWNEVPALPPALQVANLGNGAANNGGGASNLTIPRPAGYYDGCMLIAIIAIEGGNGGITDPTGWTLYHSTSNGMRLSVYYRLTDGSVDDPAGGYQWIFGNPIRALGGIIAFNNIDTTTPIFNHNVATETDNAHTNAGLNDVPELSYTIFAGAVDANEGIDPTGDTLLMQAEFEPRSTRNMAVWSEPWPQGGDTGARTFTIGTSDNHPLVSYVISLNPVQ